MEEKETKKYVFTQQEVAAILARYIESARQDYLFNARIVIGTYDIILVSDLVN